MIQLSCNFAATVGRFELEDCIRALSIDVVGLDKDGMDWYHVGKIYADLVLWSDAEIDDESLLEFCDDDPQGLYEMFEAMTEETGKLREDLDIDCSVGFLMFVHDIILVPALKPYRRAILEAVAGLFGNETLFVMWRKMAGITDADFAALGLRKIAGVDLIYRHNGWRNRLSDAHPQRLHVDFAATDKHEAWMQRKLKKIAESYDDDDDS